MPVDWAREIGSCLEEAEARVGAYYAIRPREWATRFRYDVVLSGEHPELPIQDTALAQIVRVVRPPAAERYRIVLREERISELGRSFGLATVLTTALVHELVHLVRFAEGRARFEVSEAELQEEEERRVWRITEEALRDGSPSDANLAYERLFREHPLGPR